MINLTHSASECFRRCPRRYLWQYVQRLRRVGDRSEALELGTLVHEGLELVWLGNPAEMVLHHMGTKLAQAEARDDAQGVEIATVATEMLRGYVKRWPAPTDVVAVEEKFSVKVKGLRGVRQAGKKDVRRRLTDDSDELVEHKTATKPDGSYLEKLWGDSQIIGYSLASEIQTGRKCRNVLYDVIIKPPFKRGKDESLGLYTARLHLAYTGGKTTGKVSRRASEDDDAFLARVAQDGNDWDGYLREELIISPADMDRWAADFAALVGWIRGCMRRNDWPHFTRACFDWQRACEYLPICRAGDRVEASGAEYETIADEHPELV